MSRNLQIAIGVLVAIIVLIVGVALWNVATGGAKAPKLTVANPPEGAQVTSETVTVKGTTEKGSQVRVNNESAQVGKDGSFQVTVPLETGQSFIFVKSTHSGRDTIVQRSVTRAQAAPVPSVSSGATPSQGTQPQAAAGTPLTSSGPEELVTLLGLALVSTLGVIWRKTARSS